MTITGKTKLYALIGDPVEHSLSPLMHNTAFSALGLDFVYVAFCVKQNNLEKALEGVRSLGILGFNVTIPHKVKILGLLDEVDAIAAEIGAINTVLNKQGKLIGYNTDGSAAMKVLIEEGAHPKNKKVVLLGAGGAAISIAFHIAPIAEKLIILNRTEPRANELSAKLNRQLKTSTEGRRLTIQNISRELVDANIVINATSIGMYPNIDQTLVTRKFLRPDMTVFDIIYNPIDTQLLREARMAGAKTISGVKMLVYQGVQAFEIWTGKKPPIDAMFQIVTKKLMEI